MGNRQAFEGQNNKTTSDVSNCNKIRIIFRHSFLPLPHRHHFVPLVFQILGSNKVNHLLQIFGYKIH